MRSRGAVSLGASDTLALGRVLDFMRLIWALVHALQSASKRMATKVGMTGPQRLVIRIVGQRPGLSAGELAEILHVHPSTLTGVLQRLGQRGLIRRTADPHDHRCSVLRLTAKGRKQGTHVTGTIEGVVGRALEKLTPSELAAARVVLDRLTEELQKKTTNQRRRFRAEIQRRH